MYEAGRPVLGAQATSRTQSLWPSSVSSSAHSFVSSLIEVSCWAGGREERGGRRKSGRGFDAQARSRYRRSKNGKGGGEGERAKRQLISDILRDGGSPVES